MNIKAYNTRYCDCLFNLTYKIKQQQKHHMCRNAIISATLIISFPQGYFLNGLNWTWENCINTQKAKCLEYNV